MAIAVSVAICFTFPITSLLKPVSDWRCDMLVSSARPFATISPMALPTADKTATLLPSFMIPPSPAPPRRLLTFFFAASVRLENRLTDAVALERLRSKPALSMPRITLKSAFTLMIHHFFEFFRFLFKPTFVGITH